MNTPHSPKKDRSVKILKVVVWPVVALVIVVFALVLFKDKVAPTEVQVFKFLTIKFALLKAEEQRGAASEKTAVPPNQKEIEKVAKKASAISLDGAKVLWVDDNPQNNEYERKALGALGIQFILAADTGQAFFELSKERFQLVITDFKRADDERAGYTLLMAIKNLQNPPPVIIYSSSSTPQLEGEAKAMGAFGETNQPTRLLNMAIDAIRRSG